MELLLLRLYFSFNRKEIEVDGAPSILEILDTAGTEQFASMRDLYIKNGQGFILVYSLVNAQSFHDIKPMREQICRVKGTDRVPIILVGNKVKILDFILECYQFTNDIIIQWDGSLCLIKISRIEYSWQK